MKLAPGPLSATTASSDKNVNALAKPASTPIVDPSAAKQQATAQPPAQSGANPETFGLENCQNPTAGELCIGLHQ